MVKRRYNHGLSDPELEFLRENIGKMTWAELSSHLGYSVPTLRKYWRQDVARSWRVRKPYAEGDKIKRSRKGSIGKLITYGGQTKNLTQWSRDLRCEVSYSTLVKNYRLFGDISAAMRDYRRVHLTIGGVTKTADEWSRHPRCEVSPSLIAWRYRRLNYSAFDAVFASKYERVEKRDTVPAGEDSVPGHR